MCYLCVLHEKFQAEHKEISYSWFCKLTPDNIVKPKPQDWGTCLCRTCQNPEMKLEAVNKLPQFKQKPRRVQDVSKYTDEELSEFIDEVKNIKSNKVPLLD